MRSTDDSLTDEDQEHRFDDLAKRATKAGYELREVLTGYVLRWGNSSRHCGDLATVHALLRES